MRTFASTIIGYCGQDAEEFLTKNGKERITFSVAYSYRKDDPTLWINVECYGFAANGAKGLRKGEKVVVKGYVRTYQKKDGSVGWAVNADLVGKLEKPQKTNEVYGGSHDDYAPFGN